MIKNKYEGKSSAGICPVCGEPCYDQQAGYGPINGHKGSFAQMHVHCAEKEITIYKVYQVDEGGLVDGYSICCETIEQAFEQFRDSLVESEWLEGYAIIKDTMSNLKYYTMPEFTGF
jgi:hypothetical protein